MKVGWEGLDLVLGSIGIAVVVFGAIEITLSDRFEPYTISLPATFSSDAPLTSTIRDILQERSGSDVNLCLLPQDLSVVAMDQEDAKAGLEMLANLGLVGVAQSNPETYAITPGRRTGGLWDAAVKVLTMREDLSCKRPIFSPYLLLFLLAQIGAVIARLGRRRQST